MPDAGNPLAKRLTTGRLYFTPPGQGYEEDLGNVAKFKRMDRTEAVEHLTSVGGVRIVDASYIHTLAFGYLFTLDEYVDRLLLLLQKAQGPLVATDSPGVSNGSIQLTSVVPGGTYPVGASHLSNLTVSLAGVPKTLGADYSIDLAAGRLTILSTGTIPSGANLSVQFVALPYSYRSLTSGRQPTLQGALAFYEYDQQSTAVRAEHRFSGSLWVNGDSEEQTTGFRTVELHVQCWTAPVIHERL